MWELMIPNAVLPFLRAVDAVLQVVVPPKPTQVAWISVPDYVGNSAHLFRHMVTTRSGYQHVWLVDHEEGRRRIEADVAGFGAALAPSTTVRVVDRHSARGYWSYLRSRRIFHTHGVYRTTRSAGRRDVVSLWHGMPIKCIGALNTISTNPYPTFGTMHLATSAMFRYVIAAAFPSPMERVLVTGLPRCDVLTTPHPLAPAPEAIRAAVGIPDDRRLVVWMPTYRTSGHMQNATPGIVGFRTFLDDLTDEQWHAVDRLAGEHGCFILVKLHPQDPLNETDYQPSFEHMRLMRSSEWLATGFELYDMLALSDALISDISSVLLDYLVTDRPMGIIGFDLGTYNRDVVFPVDALLRSSRIHDLSHGDQLEDFFRQVGSGVKVTPEEDDLSLWLSDTAPGTGCETVLTAVGI